MEVTASLSPSPSPSPSLVNFKAVIPSPMLGITAKLTGVTNTCMPVYAGVWLPQLPTHLLKP